MRHRSSPEHLRAVKPSRPWRALPPIVWGLVVGLGGCKGTPPALPPVPPGSGQVLIASAVLVGVSYATAPPDPSQLRDLTFATMTEEHRRESRASWTTADVVNSSLVLALIIAAIVMPAWLLLCWLSFHPAVAAISPRA